MKNFKPQLLPNFGVGVTPKWEELITNPEEWMVSDKYDGNRVEIKDGLSLGRSLKPIASKHIQMMSKAMYKKYDIDPDLIIEAEFWGEGFTFAELQHFYRSEDVTSPETRKDLENEWRKTKGGTDTYESWRTVRGEKVLVDVEWGFPGRDVDWLCKWHPELKFYIFDLYSGDDNETKLERYSNLCEMFICECEYQFVIHQYGFPDLASIEDYFDYVVENGLEGLVLINKNAKYKRGRFSEKQAQAFKMKDDNKEVDGIIIGVKEGTVIKDGVERTINELGYSTTSGKQDDRENSGMAKGFLVRLEDGQETIVSLKGYNNVEKIDMLQNPEEFIGRWIKFHAMAPVKQGGLPRHAHFTKGNFRDDK